MLYFILIILLILLAGISSYFYFRTHQTLNRLDQMLDQVLSNTFSEENFNESRLSKIESKLYRYLTKGSTAERQLRQEKEALQSLVGDISHQTKTPVANIMLYAELLKEEDSLSPSARQMTARINEQAEKLDFLFDALVKTSRLENGTIGVCPRANSVRELISAADHRERAEEKNIRLICQDIPDIYAFFDFKWTLEALNNILDNALKYTPAGGKIKISVKEYEMFAAIEVMDTGIGISEEEAAKIFTRFYRSPRVAEEKGVGIGLYLAREILQQEGGYIHLTSTLGQGSTFALYLPKK